jgi:hypothetical protein
METGARPHAYGFLMFVLTFTDFDGLGLYTWCWCPEIGTSPTDWAQLSRFYLKMDTESSFSNVCVSNKKQDDG